MVPDLQTSDGDGLVELDARGAIDVTLYWQQWRLSSTILERVADAVRAQARQVLRQSGQAKLSPKN
jgi:LysR family transcriptional regulator (chromosome initiation inhibitor)